MKIASLHDHATHGYVNLRVFNPSAYVVDNVAPMSSLVCSPMLVSIHATYGSSTNLDYTFTTIDGTATNVKNIQLVGVGASDVTVSGFTANDPTLMASDNFTVTLSFAPTNVYQSTSTMKVTYVASDGSDKTVDVTVLLVSTETATLSAPTTFDVGSATVGGSVNAPLTITNTSQKTPITISQFSIYSSFDVADFQLGFSALPILLNPGESMDVVVTFTPQDNVARNVMLFITTSIGQFTVEMSGTGVSNGTTKDISLTTLHASPTYNQLPAAPLGTVSTLMIPVQNGISWFQIVTASVSNDTSGEFVITYPDALFGRVLAPNELIFVSVTYTVKQATASYPALAIDGIAI